MIAIFIVALSICAILFVRIWWTRFKRLNRRFNFRITDIYAAMVGLAPTMGLITLFDSINGSAEPEFVINIDRSSQIFVIASMVIFQIAGLLVGRLDLELREGELPTITAWTSAVSVVTGAMIGIIALAISAAVVAVLLNLFLSIPIITVGIAAIILVIIAIIIASMR